MKSIISVPHSRLSWVFHNAILLLLVLSIYQCSGLKVEQTSNNKASIELSEGSKVHMNKNTKLEYNKSMNEERQVKFHGEGFYEIMHNAESPFTITTDGIEQLQTDGGIFNLKVDEKTIKLNVSKGEISFVWTTGQTPVILTKGQEMTVNRKSGSRRIRNVVTTNADYWRDAVLEFNATPLRDVLDDVKTIFDVQFSSSSRELLDCIYSKRFENPTLETILVALTSKFGIQFNQEREKYILIEGGACEGIES